MKTPVHTHRYTIFLILRLATSVQKVHAQYSKVHSCLCMSTTHMNVGSGTNPPLASLCTLGSHSELPTHTPHPHPRAWAHSLWVLGWRSYQQLLGQPVPRARVRVGSWVRAGTSSSWICLWASASSSSAPVSVRSRWPFSALSRTVSSWLRSFSRST